MNNRYEIWEGTKPMTVSEEASRRTFDYIVTTARILYPGHDCMLDLERKNPPPVVVPLRYANGKTVRI